MIVYVSMVADLFHSGHVQFLKKAASYGDTLIVGLITEEDAMSYKRKPIIPLENRVIVMRSCKYVDKVLVDVPLLITDKFIEDNKIDLCIHAHDKNDTSYDEMYRIPIELGIFKRLDYTYGMSTTAIINTIISSHNIQ